MKELLEKFLGLFGEGVSKLETKEITEWIKKLKEASELSTEILKKSEETKEVGLEELLDSEKWKEAIKKYVDMYISTQDVSDLMEQIKVLCWDVTVLTKKVEELEKQKNSDDEILSKTIDSTIDRIESLEKTIDETRVSKIS